MATKKRMTIAERDAAALAAEPAEAQGAAPEVEQPAGGRDVSPDPAAVEEARIEASGIYAWKTVAARVHPRIRASFTTLVSSRKREGRGGARDVLTEALEMYFLSIPPFDDYTRELHERAQAEAEAAAAAKRRR